MLLINSTSFQNKKKKSTKKNSQNREPASCFPSFYRHAFQLPEVKPVLLQVLALLFPYEAVGFSFVRILQQAASARLLQLSLVILTFLIPPHVPKHSSPHFFHIYTTKK